MKKLKLVSLVATPSLFLLTLLSSFHAPTNEEYDVVGIYQGTALESGSKCITSSGIEAASVVLTPTNLETGKYSVTVTRKEKDVYKVDGKNVYIETRYSYEYATGDDVILVVESNYGFTKGKLIFLD